jgi:signal transduction histidine kinase
MQSRSPSLRLGAIIVGVWVAIAVFTSQLAFMAIRRTGAPADWGGMMGGSLFNCLMWAAFTPGMMWFAVRFPFRREHLAVPAVVHALAAVGFAAADVLIEHWAAGALPFLAAGKSDVVTLFLRRLFLNTLCYIAVVALTMVIQYARMSREREARAVRLAAQLSDAKLQALQAQLQPHFLFNTLSMIAEQVHADPDGADRMIGRLSHLLRVSLSSTTHQEIPLADEREALEAYLDIMETRLSGRVRFDIDIPPDLHGAMVPTLILQPLAENAFRHGIEPMRRDAVLTVSARRAGGTLELTIADNGKGLDSQRYREGVGLRVVRERLEQLYRAAGSLELRGRPEGGTVATVRLPFSVLTSGGAARDLLLKAQEQIPRRSAARDDRQVNV